MVTTLAYKYLSHEVKKSLPLRRIQPETSSVGLVVSNNLKNDVIPKVDI